MTVILETHGLGKAYSVGKEQQAVLKDVNLSMTTGEFISIMGPSGSGKSTLLYMISGMERLTTGSVRFGENELASLSEKKLAALRLTEMGFIFQDIHLLRNLSLFDNIILSAYMAKQESRRHINKRAKALMKTLGIEQLTRHDTTQVSGGQLQRAAICRALINQPAILFADEPTGALNSKTAEEVMDLLVAINKEGASIFLVTHDSKVAAKSDRVLYMLDGRIVAEKDLGKYVTDHRDAKVREEMLSRWLMKMGF